MAYAKVKIVNVITAAENYCRIWEYNRALKLAAAMREIVGQRKFPKFWERMTYEDAWRSLNESSGHRIFSDYDMIMATGMLWYSRAKDLASVASKLHKQGLEEMRVDHELIQEIF